MTLTKRYPLLALYEAPPQFGPPIVLGNHKVVPSDPSGVYGPSLYTLFLSQTPAQKASCSGVTLLSCSRVMLIGAIGGGFTGKGCVGQDCSPGISLCGTCRSSIPNIGSPVTRLKIKIRPILVTCAMAGIFRPFLVTSIKLGPAGMS